MKTINVDMYQTLAVAVGVLYLGGFLKKKVRFLETFCIPSPVIGGIIFAIISCILHVAGIVEFQFDETLKTVCMVMFFTSVGFQANIKVLKAGGKSLIVFLLCLIVLIFAQNAVAVGLSKLLGVSSLVGMCTGSIPMVGGHGTSGAFGTVLEDLGQQGATSLCTAAATFGLIIGSVMGGPIGRKLILKHDLLKTVIPEDDSILVEDEQKHHRSVSMYAPAAYQLAIAMGIGTFVSWVLSYSGMTFPVYIGSMIVAAFMRNIGEYSGKIHIHMGEINDIGGICLSLFLGIAMITLKLWQLAELALPMIIMLVAQVLLMAMFSYFIVYNVMGRNYDAAVLAAGTCGLHVHISRLAFGCTYEQQEAAIARLLYFVEKFWAELLRFSRRTQSQMNRWAARYGIRLTPSEQMSHAKNSCAGRYTAVNLTNADTVEIRMFRGTLKLNTLKATLQMVNHLVEVAVSLSDSEVQDMSWFDFLDTVHEPELIQYLKECRLYVNEPVNASEEE